MKKGGAALAGPIWNAVMIEALKKLPIDSFEKPEPIDVSTPAIIRGFWQGGDTFTIDSISGGLATEFTTTEQQKEVSITNVHTILHWINKGDPLKNKNIVGDNDSQYKNWEYGIEKWWELNKNKYQNITELNRPTFFDTIHTQELKPIFEIIGIENKTYKKTENILFSINPTSPNTITKIDVFINNTYLTSLKSYPFSTSFIPNNIKDIANQNTIKVIGVDNKGNVGENILSFFVENI